MKKAKIIAAFVLSAGFFSGCSSLHFADDFDAEILEKHPQQTNLPIDDQILGYFGLKDKDVSKCKHEITMHYGGDEIVGDGYLFPHLHIPESEQVNEFIFHYTETDRKAISESLQRRERIRNEVEQAFAFHRVPFELTSVALIESKFHPHAVSPGGAAGLWQFVPTTARAYGLTVAPGKDERLHVRKSSHAAARLLGDLYEEFNDWQLALAAYNAGVGRVKRAIQSAGTRDFFELVEQGAISKETAEFVPRVLAVAAILRNPANFGFSPGVVQMAKQR